MGNVTNWVNEIAAWLEVRKLAETLSIAVNYALIGNYSYLEGLACVHREY